MKYFKPELLAMETALEAICGIKPFGGIPDANGFDYSNSAAYEIDE
jgi:hypothetical protein